MPPFCPYQGCRFNRTGIPGFARNHGYYYSAARDRCVRRFFCTGCRRTFSEATFLYDFRQKKPHIDGPLLHLLCNSVSLRAAARLLTVNRKTVVRKMLRLGRHSRRLHEKLLAGGLHGTFQLDEMETFETNRFQPVSVPVLIEKKSYFIVTTRTAPLRRKGRMTSQQKLDRAESEARYGVRGRQPDRAVRECMAQLRGCIAGRVGFESDRKPSYGRLARELFGPLIQHQTHDSRRRRDRSNPLFPINHMNAMLRYGLARLRRRTWCVTRLRGWLQTALDMYAGWFNYCRGITIRTSVSPAQAMGLAQRKLEAAEWLSWRQDWHNAGRILPEGIS